ncbi:amidohydrolase family protein [Plastorhodobacter daqingensis]|uniref:Amidohydrolase family protein n=1 Tax=Plastorhodobacter daqingensis TaxID=1387281 RepID=A0ABW2UN54_9RHOB
MSGGRLLAFPVADSHFHLWDPEMLPYPWLSADARPPSFGDTGALRRPFARKDYLAAFDGVLDLCAGVHVEAGCADPLGEAQWVSTQARADFVIGHVAQIDLRAKGGEELARWEGRVPPVGFRMRLNADRAINASGEPPDSDHFTSVLAMLNARRAVFDLSIFPEQGDAAARLAARWPEIRFVLNHLGWPRIASGRDSFATWRNMMRQLSVVPNVVVKVSMLWPIDPAWRPEIIRPFLREALELFGPERLAWGSNFPIETCFGTIEHQLESLLEVLCDLPGPALEQIFRITTCQTYGLAFNRTPAGNGHHHEQA